MGTDKQGAHNYAEHYAHHFREIRHRPLVVLEIGIAGGNSLRTWKAYFPNSEIYGIDILDKTFHDAHRIKTFMGSQADEAFLAQVIKEIGSPDVIIDDGSHLNQHVIFTFKALFPLMKPNGIYAIEDLQTSYWDELWDTKWGGSMSKDSPTSMNFLKSLVDGLNHEEFPPEVGHFPDYFDRHITGLHFYHNLAFIIKGDNSEGSNAYGQR